ncbi:MAG: tetratricopeptide repeat protein [Pseudoalteromonas sp.]
MLIRAFTYFALVLSPCLFAEPIIPADNTIIAKARSVSTAILNNNELMALLITTQQVGQTELRQGLLKSQLELRYKQSKTPDIGYMYARVLQREHQFEQALSITQEVLQKDPQHVNSHLLQANMLMVQGKFTAAKQQCLNLVGLAPMDVVNTCALDALSQDGQLTQSYQSLKNSIVINKQNETTRHVLGEMALRLNKPKAALDHIRSIELNTAPVSLVVLWADIHLALGSYQKILNSLPSLTHDNENLEDALLLRLAIAERNNTKNPQTQWQTLMSKRVQLRELRQDVFHASDLARYYLDLDQQPDKALYWAKINWQQAKLQADQQLLARAKGAKL